MEYPITHGTTLFASKGAGGGEAKDKHRRGKRNKINTRINKEKE